MDQPDVPAGPDLTQGVALAAIPEEGVLQGHVQGEPVLLVRVGAELYAVGAVCSHYGGPLAGGLVVGDTIRCPWHHACFSLRTGRALRPPGFNPIPCWEVVREGDRVRVGGRRPAPAPPAPIRSVPSSVVIVGAGAAGHLAAETLRQEGYDGAITLLTADTDPPYDRPNLSKDYLAGSAPEEWIPLRPPAFYAEQGIALRLGARVTALDPRAREVRLADGSTLGYGALLLATGADPVTLPLPGAELPQVHSLRTLADSRAIIARARSGRHAVVLGASFIGLEVAAALRARGLAVAVVAPEARPLERVMGPEVGDFLRGLHEEHGVTFHLGQTARAITPEAVTLQNGVRLPADLVVIGVGVRPATALAEQAGLATQNGVLVNEYLETSQPGIFAAGDVARWPDPQTGELVRVEHWVVAQRMGQTAARNLLGRRERFDAVPFFWTAHYDTVLAYVGHAPRWDAIEVVGDLAARDAAIALRTGGRIAAVVTLFRDRTSLLAEAALERRDQAGVEEAVRRGPS